MEYQVRGPYLFPQQYPVRPRVVGITEFPVPVHHGRHTVQKGDVEAASLLLGLVHQPGHVHFRGEGGIAAGLLRKLLPIACPLPRFTVDHARALPYIRRTGQRHRHDHLHAFPLPRFPKAHLAVHCLCRAVSLHIVDLNPVKPVLFLQPGDGGPQRSGAIALPLMFRRDHKAPYFHLSGAFSEIKHQKADRFIVVIDGKGAGGIIKYPRLRQRGGIGRHKALLLPGQLHAQDF